MTKLQELVRYRVEFLALLGFFLAILLGLLRSRKQRLLATEEFKRAIERYERSR